MKKKEIDIPGDPNVQLYKGDQLTIKYKTPAKFCIISGDPKWFKPPLPVGIAEPQSHQYSGKVQVDNGTIEYSHVGHDEQCTRAKRLRSPTGTIKIGTGKD